MLFANRFPFFFDTNSIESKTPKKTKKRNKIITEVIIELSNSKINDVAYVNVS